MKECGKGGERVGESRKEWYFYLSMKRSGKRGEKLMRMGECESS